jgi:hypothetical protein
MRVPALTHSLDDTSHPKKRRDTGNIGIAAESTQRLRRGLLDSWCDLPGMRHHRMI